MAMLALPLRLPTASYGGHMGHFLLSTLALMGSTPLGNMSRHRHHHEIATRGL